MSEAQPKPVAVVIGVGPGLGASLARRFGPKDAPALWLGEGESRRPVHIAFAAKDRPAIRHSIPPLSLRAAPTMASPASGPNIMPTTTAVS
jgi:NAD(P)-dependent dehydrogenase (short-subunit alcohol dehydrogenase family)